MARTILSAAVLIAVAAAPHAVAAQQRFAQERPADRGGQDGARGGAGVRSGNITSTGETVPNPGASQSAGTTPLDKGVEREDNKIQGSICKGC